MSLLSLIQGVMSELGLTAPSAVINSSDAQVKQFLAIANREGRELKKRYAWPQLNKEFPFTLYAVGPFTGDTVQGSPIITNLTSTATIKPGYVIVAEAFANPSTAISSNIRVLTVDSPTQVTMNQPATSTMTADSMNFSQDSYPMPGDYERFVNRTQWDRNYRWELRGPISPQEWQWRKSGVIVSSPRRRFRVKGDADNALFIDPPPGVGDTNQVLVFEYQSRSWCRPVTWTSGATFAAKSYCAYNGNIYYTSGGGITGATPPTHVSGSASDGAVTWTFYNLAYDQFLADTDLTLLSEEVIGLGIKWRWMQQKGFQNWMDINANYEAAVIRESSYFQGARTLDMTQQPYVNLIGMQNIPSTGFGNP